ncbi:MAG: T9SS type A sorting domain-containing protein [Saprospiraceae bacterium]|nr:T9SS type A sorting domain-containing protein [Saprospiraceae bacterium]
MKLFTTFFFSLFVFSFALAQVPELVKDINPGTDPAFNPNSYTGTEIVEYNGKLYFTANGGNTTTGHELWMTDGTNAGTSLVKDINPGPSSSSGRNYSIVNGNLLFLATGSGTGKELWRTDGTDAGTVMVKDIALGMASGIPTYNNTLFEAAVWNDVLYFTADDGTTGPELWRSDGTTDGTYLVKNINTSTGTGNGSYPSYFAAHNGKLYFAAQDTIIGRELWVTDGTELGTHLVKDISTDFLGSYPSDMVSCNGYLLFIANGGFSNGGVELFRTDGTNAGTVRVKDVYPGFNNGLSSSLTNEKERKLVKIGNKIYFSGSSTDGRELWSSDGTESGTVMVANASTSNQTMGARNFGVIGNVIYYKFDDGVHGEELWRSDGTAAGTYLVSDVVTGSGSSFTFTTYLSTFNGYVFFNANDGTTGDELWKSDGTDAGTVLVGDLNPGSTSAFPFQFTSLNDDFFFGVETPITGVELWKLHVEPFVPLVAALQQTHIVSCFDGADGALSLTVSGGSTPYSYAWTPSTAQGQNPTGLSAGIYTVTVTDANGATITATFEITQPPALSTSVSSVAATYSNANGSASVTVTGGTSPYTYLWNNVPPSTTAAINNVIAGDYTVVVTDANGCTISATVMVDMETAVDEIFANSIIVAPTFSNGQFMVLANSKLTELQLALTDTQGKMVKYWKNVSTGQSLSIDEPLDGVYFLQISSEGKQAVKTLVFRK